MTSVKNILLGVNIDHVATLREARKTFYPSILEAAHLAEKGGADGITVHLREDRRHIQDRDVEELKETIATRLNLEMAVTPFMVAFAKKIRPAYCCFVPEKRAELTTEGGLNVIAEEDMIHRACVELREKGIEVSLFIDPDEEQIQAAVRCEAPIIEIHTGKFAEAKDSKGIKTELQRIKSAATFAKQNGLIVNAGHGLHYENTALIAEIPELHELNIGHSIIARALFIGLENAVREMKKIMVHARQALLHHSSI